MSASSFDMWPPVAIAGTGSYVPERVVTNDELIAAGSLDTTDAWVVEKTGIRERRFAAEDQATSDLAIIAGRRALEAADVFPEDIDLVIVATSTPDWPQPATASAVHHGLGLRADAGAFDLNAVCSGFVHALHTGSALLAGGESWNAVLVIGADCYSRITDPRDRGTRIFFGDGAGAVVLQKRLEFADVAAMAAAEAGVDPNAGEDGNFLGDVDGGLLDEETPGIRSVAFTVDHAGKDALIVRGGGSRDPRPSDPGDAYFRMDGPAVREFAVPALVAAVETACAAAHVLVEDLAVVVPHQSNRRMLEAAIDELGLPEARLATTVEHYGNTAAASIPITLDDVARSGRIADGDLICLAGYGGGLQSAAAVVRWG